MLKDCIEFLGRLSQNNDRVWFIDHKKEYLECKAVFDAFTRQLIDGIRSFDDSIGPLDVKDCTYRIYRDTRFSQDKSPYKLHMGAFIVPEGKKSGYSGYYFQIGPQQRGYDAGCMLASGNYCCEPRVLKLLREDIALDEGKEFSETLKAAPAFSLDWDGALKRIPAGFEAGRPYSDWLRLRNYCLVREPGLAYVQAPHLIERLLVDFKSTMPFLHFVNRAIAFTRE